MERYKCRLCLKSFINGRALGGHMRSHMLKRELYGFTIQEQERPSQLSDEDTESDSSSSSSSSLGNPKRNHVLDDELEFGFSDESETEEESSRLNPTRKRSKRTRKLGSFDLDFKKLETEHHNSSASDTTTEEDLAFCLIMLSRDKWKKQRVEEEDERRSKKSRFKCETCEKVFKSYQALGGHRASHKKNKTCVIKTEHHEKTEYDNGVRVHECPICFRVFSSGQALGGHKRSHGINIGSRRGGLLLSVKNQEEEEVKERMIDLNLPAPNEDDESSVVVDER